MQSARSPFERGHIQPRCAPSYATASVGSPISADKTNRRAADRQYLFRPGPLSPHGGAGHDDGGSGGYAAYPPPMQGGDARDMVEGGGPADTQRSTGPHGGGGGASPQQRASPAGGAYGSAPPQHPSPEPRPRHQGSPSPHRRYTSPRPLDQYGFSAGAPLPGLHPRLHEIGHGRGDEGAAYSGQYYGRQGEGTLWTLPDQRVAPLRPHAPSPKGYEGDERYTRHAAFLKNCEVRPTFVEPFPPDRPLAPAHNPRLTDPLAPVYGTYHGDVLGAVATSAPPGAMARAALAAEAAASAHGGGSSAAFGGYTPSTMRSDVLGTTADSVRHTAALRAMQMRPVNRVDDIAGAHAGSRAGTYGPQVYREADTREPGSGRVVRRPARNPGELPEKVSNRLDDIPGSVPQTYYGPGPASIRLAKDLEAASPPVRHPENSRLLLEAEVGQPTIDSRGHVRAGTYGISDALRDMPPPPPERQAEPGGRGGGGHAGRQAQVLTAEVQAGASPGAQRQAQAQAQFAVQSAAQTRLAARLRAERAADSRPPPPVHASDATLPQAGGPSPKAPPGGLAKSWSASALLSGGVAGRPSHVDGEPHAPPGARLGFGERGWERAAADSASLMRAAAGGGAASAPISPREHGGAAGTASAMLASRPTQRHGGYPLAELTHLRFDGGSLGVPAQLPSPAAALSPRSVSRIQFAEGSLGELASANRVHY